MDEHTELPGAGLTQADIDRLRTNFLLASSKINSTYGKFGTRHVVNVDTFADDYEHLAASRRAWRLAVHEFEEQKKARRDARILLALEIAVPVMLLAAVIYTWVRAAS